jgi:hypothetical protein
MVKRCFVLWDNIITHLMESITGATMNAAMEESERWIREHKSNPISVEDG